MTVRNDRAAPPRGCSCAAPGRPTRRNGRPRQRMRRQVVATRPWRADPAIAAGVVRARTAPDAGGRAGRPRGTRPAHAPSSPAEIPPLRPRSTRLSACSWWRSIARRSTGSSPISMARGSGVSALPRFPRIWRARRPSCCFRTTSPPTPPWRGFATPSEARPLRGWSSSRATAPRSRRRQGVRSLASCRGPRSGGTSSTPCGISADPGAARPAHCGAMPRRSRMPATNVSG